MFEFIPRRIRGFLVWVLLVFVGAGVHVLIRGLLCDNTWQPGVLPMVVWFPSSIYLSLAYHNAGFPCLADLPRVVNALFYGVVYSSIALWVIRRLRKRSGSKP